MNPVPMDVCQASTTTSLSLEGRVESEGEARACVQSMQGNRILILLLLSFPRKREDGFTFEVQQLVVKDLGWG